MIILNINCNLLILIMTYTLLIVESPAKCGKIESFLGAGYKCIASYGHIQELPGIKYIDINNNFKPNFMQIDAKSQQIRKMQTMINNSKNVLLATDDDRSSFWYSVFVVVLLCLN